jgi:hypothetical protein
METPSQRLKLHAAYDFDKAILSDMNSIKEPFSDIAKAFKHNIGRVQMLAWMPTAYHQQGYHNAWILAKGMVARGHVRTGFSEDLDRIQSLPESEQREVWQVALRLRREGAEQRQRLGREAIELKQSQDAFDRVMDEFGEPATINVELILQSQLVGAWTAFEILAPDLWVKALNVCPNPFALAAIQEKPTNAAPSTQSASELTAIRTAIKERPSAISEAGEVIKLTKKFAFDSLGGICDAYCCAFKKAASPLECKAIFETQEFKEVAALEAVRNVLVHAGGTADALFRDRSQVAANHEQFKKYGLGQIKIGDRVQINGEMVKGIVEATAKASLSLIAFVEKRFAEESTQK